jgi:hypothetical protein
MNVHGGALRIEHPFQVTQEQCEAELSRLGALLDDQIPADMRWSITELHDNAEPLSLDRLARLIDETFTQNAGPSPKASEAETSSNPGVG